MWRLIVLGVRHQTLIVLNSFEILRNGICDFLI